MSGFINTPIASAPRQKGLKKPRPLRSISNQEIQGHHFKREKTERQISADSPPNPQKNVQGTDLRVDNGFRNTTLEGGDGFGQADPSGALINNQEGFSLHHFQRQNSTTSQDSNASSQGQSRKSSMSGNSQNPPPLSVNTTMKPVNPHVDANANTLTGSPRSEKDEDFFSISTLHKQQFQEGPSDPKAKNQDRENITLATLLTTKGKQLVLSGTCIQTILNACRHLLQEMGASIIRLETVENSDIKTKDVIPRSPTELSPKPKTCYYYTKEELLALSESNLSRKAPAMWNVLARNNTDCCIPAGKILEYFEPIDFHSHDGTLVTEESRRRDRRE